ncbi:unnamed protein product [Vitrella brassicaformis CCMP3155]|uniref:Uncharacterized protein n=1 Tax=Vitrella brassicaformis (strain CCMP3155) TaxID=1169540 RepID=A0A0G4FW28_VITBC|nr:unnamed protein product [Vitrella brassicaformis CCMP3155]|eukprot:CEM19404.1 unnamed protein product [Vitrella brassicaformis CCMP3155]
MQSHPLAPSRPFIDLSSPAPALRSSGSSPPDSSPSSLRTFTLQVGHIYSAGQTEGSFELQGKDTSTPPELQFIRRLVQDRKNDRLTSGVQDNPHAKEFLERITQSDEAFLDFLQNDLKFSGFDCRSDLWTGAIAAVSFLSSNQAEDGLDPEGGGGPQEGQVYQWYIINRACRHKWRIDAIQRACKEARPNHYKFPHERTEEENKPCGAWL